MYLHGMLVRAVRLSGIFVSMALATQPAGSQIANDEAVVRDIIQEETAAWNRGDAVLYSRHFAEDGVFTNILGQFFIGHDAFLRQHEFIFKGPYHGTTVQLDIISLKFLRPDVVIIHTLSSVTGFEKLAPGLGTDSKGRLRTRLMQVFLKRNGQWAIADYHNIDVKSQIPVSEPQARRDQ